MNTNNHDWKKWDDYQPASDTRVMLRGAAYTGAAHFVDDRLRAWSSHGYGADLAIDPLAEWYPLTLGSLPNTFTVD